MKFFPVLLIISALSRSLFASDVNLQVAFTSGLSFAGGDDLSIGTPVFVGTFNGLTDAELKAHATDVAYLSQNFLSYGAPAHIGDGSAPAGYMFGKVTNTTNPAAFTGAQMYYFVVAATNTTTTAQTFATAYQIGIYYYDKAQKPSWAFPAASTPSPTATTVDISDLTDGGNGTAVTSPFAHLVIGSFGLDNSNTFPTKKNFSLANVPEPGTCALLGMSVVIFISQRRRRWL